MSISGALEILGVVLAGYFVVGYFVGPLAVAIVDTWLGSKRTSWLNSIVAFPFALMIIVFVLPWKLRSWIRANVKPL